MSKRINSEDSSKDGDNSSKNSESDSKSKDESNDENNDNSERSSIEELHDSLEKSEDSANEDEDYNKLKEEMDKANNFIDYFLVVGVEPEIYKNDWLYECDIDELNVNYKQQLQPKIISSFPLFEKHTISFDESLLMHCFPNGYKIIEENEKPKPKLFSFILDNNFYNLNYPKKYLSCLIFYERITQYKILYDEYLKQYSELSGQLYESQNNEDNNTYDNIYIPKCLVVMSLYPYFGEFERILNEVYNYSKGFYYEANDKIEKNIKTKKSTSKSPIKSLFKSPTKSPSKRNMMRKATFAPNILNKTISLQKMVNNEIINPIDKMIENLLIELPVPPRGIYRIEYSLNNQQRKLHQNEMNQLPYVDINLKKIFLDFDIKDIIKIYRHLFLETRLLFFSENIELLNIYIFSFLSFLYPFDYQYQIVTILPHDNYEILESITPFIAGINECYEDEFFDKFNFTLSDEVLIIDIDNKKITMANEQSETPNFPKTYRKQLEKDLSVIINFYLKDEIDSIKNLGKRINYRKTFTVKENSINMNLLTKNLTFTEGESHNDDEKNEITLDKNSNWNINYDFNSEIQQIFFNFNAKLLSNYSKYLNLDFYSSNSPPSLESLFKVEEYLKEFSNNDKPFYNKFITETQIFGDFIFMRMIPKNSKEKIHILSFDEKINENSAGYFSQPVKSVFTESEEYKFNIDIVIQKPHELSMIEKNMYLDQKNRLGLIKYGIITQNLSDDKITFKYPIFPKLLADVFFKNNIRQFIEPINLNENIKSINEDIILKSHLGGVKMRQNDMANYIYLCWMQMWGMTFWYCDEREKNYRFQELLKVINRTSNHEMEIFNLLFETLLENGTDYMILKLYDILIKLRLNPSLKVHNITMKILESEKGEGKLNENLQRALNVEEGKTYTKGNFRKRTIKSKYFKNILTENILFYAFDACMGMECQKEINLLKASTNYKEMARDLIWAKCPDCGEYMLPKLTIHFGKELNINGNMNNNTSKYDSIVLFSPLSLKENYNNSLLKDYGIKLDVEQLLEKHSTTFWNTLWYFKINNLDYDFMLPYEHNMDIITFNINQDITTTQLYNLNSNNNQKAKINEIISNKDDQTIKDEDGEDYKYDKDELKIYHFEFAL